jgi:hypothetical protein
MSNTNDTLINKDATENSPKTAPVDTMQNATEHVNEAKSSHTPGEGEKDNSDLTAEANSVDPTANLEFNRVNVEALGNHIHLVDSDEESKLDMFCYVKCGEEDSDLLKQCRGVVFNGNDIVMKAFPYTSEYGHSDMTEINSHIGEFGDWSFYDAHEGALVRMFNFDGKWYVSTHRKLNAFRSKWASRESFGTSFKNALSKEEECNPKFKVSLPAGDNILERFQCTLDVSKQYMFLIRNTNDNRIVCNAPDRATVYHVGTFVDGQLVFDEDVNIPVPTKHTFLNIDELLDYVEKMSYKDLQGVIGFTSDNRQVKILHKDYQDLFKARGNEPSIKFRYLQIRMNRRFVNMLYHLYPEMTQTFDEYENTLYDIARSIYRAYVQRFIKKRYVTVPREEFAVIRECHTWHLTDRQNNRISLNQIVRVMNLQSPTHLNHMIRRFKLEQTRQTDQQNITRPRSDSVRSNKSFEQSPDIRQIHPTPVPISPLILSDNDTKKKNNRSRAAVHLFPRKPLYTPKESKDTKIE